MKALLSMAVAVALGLPLLLQFTPPARAQDRAGYENVVTQVQYRRGGYRYGPRQHWRGRHWHGRRWHGPRYRYGPSLGVIIAPPVYGRPVYRAPRYVAPARPAYGLGPAHVNWCYSRYRSYRASDNTFQPYNGPRRPCYSPYS